MKRPLHLFKTLLLLILLGGGNVYSQVRYPVNITHFNITPSVFLSDYTTPGSGSIKASLRFTDYNEANITVYLSLSIEGPNARLVSSAAFRPTEAYTLVPGEPLNLQDADFSAYFQLQNLQCQGISQADLQRTDQLPEGWYTFTLQAMDLSSGKPVSLPVSTRANLSLIDPPILFTPENGKLIRTTFPQINFQWQQNAHASLSKLQIEYFLRLFEIPEGEDPIVSMQNRTAREVFLSEPIRSKVYNYGIADFPLDPGKRYAYSITAQDAGGRKWFKNNGKSEIGWFYYGYPTGGKISLTYPKNEEALNRKMIQQLEWSANNNLVDNTQNVIYYAKIVELDEGDNPTTSIENKAFWEFRSDGILNKSGFSTNLPSLGSEKRYAWQVKAFTDDIEVGKSDVQTFYSPPALDEFIAAYGHIIQVTQLTNSKLKDLSGKGKVKINASGRTIDVHFEHIVVENIDGILLMTGGEIKCNIEGVLEPIILTPNNSINDKAICYPDSIRIDGSKGMYIHGRVEWDYPFGTTSSQKSKVKFQPTWFDFNEGYKLLGTPNVIEEQGYHLLEPANFYMKLDKESHAQVLGNRWEMVFSGELFVSSSVKGTQREDYSIAFTNWNQLYYNQINGYANKNEIRLIDHTQLHLAPDLVIVDLSEEQSPLKFVSQADWKGIYFEKFNLRLSPETDEYGQITLTEALDIPYTLSATDSFKSWIIGDGLQFLHSTQITKEGIVLFNTFPSKVDLLSINIQKSAVIQAQLKGSIRIPVISQTERYSYSLPITNKGFQTGYLDKSLEGLSFVFNETSPDQRIQAKIKRAVFASQNHLDMDLELKWDKIGVTFTDLQQFCAWGDAEIGFVTPKGIANLNHQIQGVVEGRSVNIEQIGCGRMCNQYSFGLSASVVMDADISGIQGAPKLNLYSIAQNSLLTGDCNMEEQVMNPPQTFSNEGSFEMTDEGVGAPGTEANMTLADMDARNAKMSAQIDALNNTTLAMGTLINAIHYDTVPITGKLFDNSLSPAVQVPMNIPEELSLRDMMALLEASKFILDKELYPQIDSWIALLKQLEQGSEEVNSFVASMKGGGLVRMLVDMGMQTLMPIISDPIVQANNAAKKFIIDFVDDQKNKGLNELDKLIDQLAGKIKSTTEQGISVLEDKETARSEINEKISLVVARVKTDVHTAVTASVNENFTGYFIRFMDTVVHVRALAFVDSTLRTSLVSLLSGKTKEISVNTLKENCSSMLNQIAQDAKNLVNTDKLLGMLSNTGKDILNKFNWESLAGEITTAFVADKAVQTLNHYMPDAVKTMYQNAGTSMLGSIASNVELDFNTLKSGNLKDAIKFDPTAIKIDSKVVKGEGYAQLIKGDPIYGDVFKAGLNVEIKVPKPFNAFATFVNGKQTQENFDYWFVEFGARKLGLSMAPIPLVFDGGAGRVFKHMSRPTPNSEYIPDKKNQFGAGVKAFFYDQSGGGIAIFDVDFEMQILEAGFNLTMSGNALLGNNISYAGKTSKSTSENSSLGQLPVSRSLAIGYGEMGYSSLSNIFYAKAAITLGTSPILCGGGEFNAMIAPNEWSLSIGTRDNPIGAKLLCLNSISISSWLSINKTMLDVGIKQNVDIGLRTPWINLNVVKTRAYANLSYQYGGEAVVFWKPFRIKDARIYAGASFAIGVEYETPLNSGKIDLLSVGFGGELTYLSRTKEELTADKGTERQVTDYLGESYAMLYGHLYGYVTVIGFSIGVDFEAKKEWKG